MWRQMLTFILLPCLFGATSDVSTKPETNEEHYLYFPLVEHLPIRMEVVVTSKGRPFLSDWSHIYGYVLSQEPDPIIQCYWKSKVPIYLFVIPASLAILSQCIGTSHPCLPRHCLVR